MSKAWQSDKSKGSALRRFGSFATGVGDGSLTLGLPHYVYCISNILNFLVSICDILPEVPCTYDVLGASLKLSINYFVKWGGQGTP
jgi:hypothetical protein